METIEKQITKDVPLITLIACIPSSVTIVFSNKKEYGFTINILPDYDTNTRSKSDEYIIYSATNSAKINYLFFYFINTY